MAGAMPLIGFSDIRRIGADPLRGLQIYELKSPLTNEWTRFEIEDQWIANDTGDQPYPDQINPLLEYYFWCRIVLNEARNFAPLNHDLTALHPDEARMFGVKYRLVKRL